VPVSGERTEASACDGADQPLEFRNRLLAALSDEALSALRPHLEPMTLPRGAVLCEAGDSMWRVCFVENGLTSLVTERPTPVVIATAGREGAVGGSTLLLGGGVAFGRYQMLTPGAAFAVDAARFCGALRENRRFRSLCETYTQAFFVQVFQNVACSRLHAAEQRCARWLLMCDDQIGDDMFELAQDSLAAMLGVPQMVADAVASTMHRTGLIRFGNGLISIDDRRKLQGAACSCYRTWHNRCERLWRACGVSRRDPDQRQNVPCHIAAESESSQNLTKN
jgi:hypothetical protein